MKIVSYVELTPAQERTLDDFDKLTVRTSLLKPTVIATIKTWQGQEIKATIDAAGVIELVALED